MSRKTRKLIWSAPLVAVLAVIGALAIFAAQPPEPALAHDIPGAVSELKAETQDDGSINLTWSPPTTGGAPTGYRIDYLPKAEGDIWKLLVADNGSATTYPDEDPGIGTGRDYRVFAFNEHGTGPVSVVVGAAIPAPGAPGKVPTLDTPRAVGYSQLNLSWTAPEKDGGSPITSYRIVMATNGSLPVNANAVTPNPSVTLATGADTTIDTGSDATTYSVMGLRAQQTWMVSVYARNKAGNNSPDTTAAATMVPIIRTQVTGPAVKPKAPTNLVATYTAADGLVNLYWLGPTDDGGGDLTKYRIEVRESGKNWPKADTTLATSAAELNEDINGDGFGVMEVLRANFSTTAVDFSHDTDDTTDLSGKTLQYRVFAANGAGTSDSYASVGIRAAANSNQPSAPTAGNPFFDNATSSSLDLHWERATGAEAVVGSGYRIDYRPTTDAATNPWVNVVPNTNFTNLQYTHSNRPNAPLMPSTGYTYRIFNIKAGVTGPAFQDATATTGAIQRPDAPSGLTATVVNGEQVNLTWKAPKKDGGAEVTDYYVHVSSAALDRGSADVSTPGDSHDAIAAMPAPCATDVDAVFRTKSTDVKYSVKGLCAQKTYNFGVTAYNGAAPAAPEGDRRSRLSNTVTAVTDSIGSIMEPGGFVAEAAQDNNLTGGTERGVLLIWNAPDDPTGGRIVTYEIERKVDDEEFVDLEQGTLTGTDGSATDPYTGPITYHTDESEPGADEKRVYRIRAKAQVLGATNAPVTTETITSDWVMVSYDLAGTPMHTHNMAPTTVGSIDDMTFTMGDMASTMDVMRYFMDDDGDTLTYAATVMPADGSVATAMIDGSMLTVTPMGVGDATITVTATDADGSNMMATQTFMVTVNAAPMDPIRPTINSVSVLRNSITVSWDRASTQDAEIVKVVLFDLDANGDVLRLAMGYDGNVKSYAQADDPGIHDFTNVPPGTYKVGVANYSNGMHRTIVSAVVTVQ